MAQIPLELNAVLIHFGAAVVNDVDQKMLDALKQCIKPHIAAGCELYTVFISSAYDSHQPPSRHMQQKAVDISRINGTKIGTGYPQGGAVKAIVDAIQKAFEASPGRRENFGPLFKKKLGQSWPVSGHSDHIHLSVN